MDPIIGISHGGKFGPFGVGLEYGLYNSNGDDTLYGGIDFGVERGLPKSVGLKADIATLDIVLPARGYSAQYVADNAAYAMSVQAGVKGGVLLDANFKVIGVISGIGLGVGFELKRNVNSLQSQIKVKDLQGLLELKALKPNSNVILKELEKFGIDLNGLKCFPGSTPILAPFGHTPISQIQIGDVILAFDPTANFGRGALVEKRVTKLFRNTTTEWIELDFGKIDPATGESF